MSKNIAKNSLYSICYKLMNVFFPLIISSYGSHILLSNGIGKVALVQNISNYFVMIASMGIPNYGTKMIGSIQNDLDKVNRVFTELFIINAISTLICATVYYLLIFSVPYFRSNSLYMVFSVLILINVINVDWLYQGLEEYRYIAVRSVMVKLISIILLFILVKEKNDIYKYAIILCIATGGNHVFNIINLRKKVHFVTSGLKIKRHLKKIFILLASVCATEIYTMLDSTMVGTICSETELGYYTNAMKTARMTYVLTTAACAVYLPRLSLYYKENKGNEFNALLSNGMKVVLVLSIPIFCGVEILADIIIPVLFGEDFILGITTLRILAVLVIVFSIAFIGGHIVLIACNKEKYTMYGAFVGAGSNCVLNLFLIKSIGFNGAAIASVIAELIVTIYLIRCANKYIKYNIPTRFLVTTIGSSFLMSLVVVICKTLISNSITSLIICIVCGAFTYFIALFMMKNEFVTLLVQQVIGCFKQNK